MSALVFLYEVTRKQPEQLQVFSKIKAVLKVFPLLIRSSRSF